MTDYVFTADASVDVFTPVDSNAAWSTAGSWSLLAPPGSGADAQTDGTGFDDIGGTQTLGNLSLNGFGTSVTSGTLTIANVDTGGLPGSELNASGGSVTVQADSGGAVKFGVDGTSSVFTDLSTSDVGTYGVRDGGKMIVSSTQASGSTYDFETPGKGGSNTGTIALGGLSAGTVTSTIQGLASGDRIEVQGSGGKGGSTSASVSFGTDSLTITTTAGTYTFANVSYAGNIGGYTVGYDTSTHLVTLTMTSEDVFTPNGGSSVWSSDGNWSMRAPPGTNANVQTNGMGSDDVGGTQTLNNFYLNGFGTSVTSGSLTIANLETGGLSGSELDARGSSVTVQADGGGAVTFGAFGSASLFTDFSTSDVGTYTVQAGAKMIVSSTQMSGSTYDFESSGKGGTGTGTIALGGLSTGTITSTIEGLTGGDRIELQGTSTGKGGTTSATVSFGATSLTITTTAGTYTFADVAYGPDVGGYTAGYDSTTGLVEITVAPCYRTGTRIATPHGEVPIEQLRIGDCVETLSGVEAIRWIGRRSYRGAVLAGDADLLPVRIRANALGTGLPKRDLWVSPEHALYLDGLLIPARALVNGGSIAQEAVDEVCYLHLELDRHAVIIAEGVLAESYADDESRFHFDNAHEYHVLYPHASNAPVPFCAPRVEQGDTLEAVRRRLMTRSAVVGPQVTRAAAA